MWRELLESLLSGEAARAVLPVMADVSVKGALLLAAAAALAAALRRSAAAKRHLIWALALLALVALPVLAALLPRWRIEVPALAAAPHVGDAVAGEAGSGGASVAAAGAREAMTSPRTTQDPARAGAAASARGTGGAMSARGDGGAAAVDLAPVEAAGASRRTWARTAGAGTSGPATSTSEPAAATVSAPGPNSRWPGWPALLLAVWAAGSAAVTARIALGLLRLRRLSRRARPLLSHRARGVARRIAAELGLRRRIRLLEGEDDAMPMTWGALRPALLLPRGAGGWPARRLEVVLRHELAHIRRRDALMQLVAQAACALHWMNPLVWLAARRLRLEQEHACDDVVLRAGSRASDYASELLAMALLLRARRTSAAAIAMARQGQLEPRVAAMLDDTRGRDVTRRWVRLACALAALVILPLAALEPARAGAAQDAAPPPPAATPAQSPDRAAQPALAPYAEPVSPVAPPAGGLGPAPESPTVPARGLAPYAPTPPRRGIRAVWARAQEGCWPGSSRIDRTNSRTDDDEQRVTWSGGGCKGEVRIEGTLRFTEDFAGIAGISRGGLFRFEHDDGEVERRLTIRPADGGLAYEYRVDGAERPWDDQARAWFAEALVHILRHTGLAADERTAYLLRQGGPDAVLAEVDLMSSDHVQRLYLSELVEQAALDDAQLRAAAETAGRELESDHHLAEFLITLAREREFDAATRSAIIASTGTIESDHHQRRVLEAVLARADLAPADVAAMLAAAQRIESDHHRAELLLGLTGRYRIDPAMRPAYLAAARAIGSDHHKRRVFAALLEQGDLAPAELAEVLDAAAAIQSDHHRAELLLALVGSGLSDPTVQQAFVKASTDIQSDHHLRRTLSGLMEGRALAPEALDVVLAAARSIESDHHLAELLLEIVRTQALTPAQRDRVMQALETIESQHYRGLVAEALLRRQAS